MKICLLLLLCGSALAQINNGGGGGSGTVGACGAAGNAYYSGAGTTTSCDTSIIDNGSGQFNLATLVSSNNPITPYALDTGAASAYAITVFGLPNSIAAGLCVTFKAANAASGASTLNVTPSGQAAYGAIALDKRTTAGVAATAANGDVLAGGIYRACYDGTEWVLEATSGSVQTGVPLTIHAPTINNGGNQITNTTNLLFDATNAFFTKYNNVAVVGQGVPPILASVNQTAQTAAITTATLCTAALCGNAAAGVYHVHFVFWGSGTACSSVTAGSVTFLLTWTDENAVTHAAVALQMQAQTGAATTAIQASFPFQTALANESASGDFTMSTNGTIIQYATGYTACTTGTGTYNVRAVVYRVV